MLNYLWGFMLLLGITYGAFQGRMEAVTNGILDSAKEAVTLCISMLGIMGTWVGIMEIGRTSGLIEALTRKLEPLIHFLFPRIPKGHKSREYILLNVISNVLGLGWAATPAGLRAMEELSRLEEERGNEAYLRDDLKSQRRASEEMCTFLAINISSLQLIPVNMIAYRSQYGSVSPAVIVAPAILATLCSTLTVVLLCRLLTGGGGRTCRKRS